jgi:hypothetical protein
VGGVRLSRNLVEGSGNDPGATIWVSGFYDRPFVGQIVGVVEEMQWEPTIVEGDCVYLEERVPRFCDPACDATALCVDGNQCEPYPVLADAGDLTVTGLSVPLTLTASPEGWYSAGTDLPDDAFTGGETVTLAAAGHLTPAFTTSAVAPGDLEPAAPCTLEHVQGEDQVITWTPGDGAARIRWSMVSAFHAGDGPMVLCDAPDTGTLVVPAAILDAYEQDRTAYETFYLTRYARGYADVGGGHGVVLELAFERICFHYPGSP